MLPVFTQSQSALLTDLHQLINLNAMHELDMQRPAVFEFYVRRLPATRNFLVACGIESVLEYLEQLRFSQDELEWLDGTGRFDRPFLDWLQSFRFSGDVYAMPEGTVFFADEPVLRIMAPLPQGQLIESRLMNLLHFQTAVASKAARYRIVAGNKRLIDAGLRRAHGAEASLLSARASYIAGFDASTNVEAARHFDLPLEGTMAHSFVQAHRSEVDCFSHFAQSNPRDVTLVLDTFDVERAAHRAAEFAKRCKDRVRVRSVRLDSGHLADESRRVRSVLDGAELAEVQIMVSGALEEDAVAALVRWGAPIDSFSVDSRLDVAADTPILDCGYNLQEYDGSPCRRRSVGKTSWPGRRQVHRTYDDHGHIGMDLVCCADEVHEGKALVQSVMVRGRRQRAPLATADVRRYCLAELATLPEHLRTLDHGPRSPVKISQALRELTAEVDRAAH